MHCILSPLPVTSRKPQGHISSWVNFQLLWAFSPFPQVHPQEFLHWESSPDKKRKAAATSQPSQGNELWQKLGGYGWGFTSSSSSTPLHFNCPSHSPVKKREKSHCGHPAQCWKGLCPWRGCADRHQGSGSAVTSFIRLQGNISHLWHKIPVITQG